MGALKPLSLVHLDGNAPNDIPKPEMKSISTRIAAWHFHAYFPRRSNVNYGGEAFSERGKFWKANDEHQKKPSAYKSKLIRF